MILPKISESVSTTATPEKIAVDGGYLFAMVQSAQDAPVTQCVILLNSGMLNCSGPHRLYWNFSQKACARGIATVRVDLAGVGDSQSEVFETHFDNHSPEHVDAVVAFVKQRWPNAEITLLGLCAGARVAFKSAADNPSVDRVIGWSTEIFTASQNMPQSPHEPNDRMSEYEVNDTLTRLVRFVTTGNFLRPSWWRKEFPGGEGLVDAIKHTGKVFIKKMLPAKAEKQGAFLASTDSYLAQDRPVKFLFGEHDHRAYEEFRSRFPQVQAGDNSKQCYQVIKDGTHTFSNYSSQTEVIEQSLNWLKSNI